MVRKPSNHPTDAELAILTVIWDRGRATVREVHAVLEGTSGVGYTTVLKTLQIMTDKGLVRRDETSRAHVYEATSSREDAQRGLVGDLVDRAFAGSAARLAMQALAGGQASSEEIAAIRRLLDSLEEDES